MPTGKRVRKTDPLDIYLASITRCTIGATYHISWAFLTSLSPDCGMGTTTVRAVASATTYTDAVWSGDSIVNEIQAES